MKVRNMTRCAMCAAMMAVCAWLAVPVGEISVTMQSFAIFLTLSLLGGKLGTLSCLIYLALGALGLPVFSGMQGGLGILLGPTGGYLWGFLISSLIYWILEGKGPKWAIMTIGMLVCYVCGTAWYYLAYAQTALWALLLKCVVPYLIPDALKISLALLLTQKLKHNER